MRKIYAVPGKSLPLGRLGENERTQIVFPVSDWLEEYPDATIALINRRPNEKQEYPIVITGPTNGEVFWTVKNTELAIEGDGECMLQVLEGEVVAKSASWKTKIYEALTGADNPPEPWESLIDDITELVGEAEDAQEAAEDAQEAAEDAQEAAEGAAEDAEAYAVGKRGGTDVGSSDPAYHNNSKYYAEQASDSATSAGSSASSASTDAGTAGTKALVSEGYAVGKQNGTDVESGSAYYHNNSKYYAEQAAASAAAAANIIDDTAGAGDTDKTFSADKLVSDRSELLNAINGLPETESTTEENVDLDITDEDGNVIARLNDGGIQTKEFNSADAPLKKNTNAENVDLDISDEMGNVILRLKDGGIQTKRFNSADLFPVPDYYHVNGYLKGKCDRFNQLARACAKKMDTFAFCTDQHWTLNAKQSPALLRFIKQNTMIDKFFFGGDFCDFMSESIPFEGYSAFHRALENDPLYMTLGNHDYMTSYGTEGRLYYSFNSLGRDRVGNFDRNYFYIDNQQSMIRYIFLNGFQPNGSGSWSFAFEQTQLDWLENIALDIETGWGAIIITHMVRGIDLDNQTVYTPSEVTAMLSVLDSYSGNGEIIAVICGHTHFDYVDQTTGGIPIIISTCDKYEPWISGGVNKEPWLSDRVAGTITEQAIDLYIVDRESKTLTRVRVGVPIHDGFDPETWTEVEEETVSYDRE